MLAISILPSRFQAGFKYLALTTTLAQFFIFCIFFLPDFFSNPPAFQGGSWASFSHLENLNWIQLNLGNAGQLAFRYAIGLDGFNFGLVALSVIIFPIAILSSWNILKKSRAYYLLFLLLNISVLGCFCALDLFLFFLFFEFMLLPMFFLIGVWGYENKEYAAVKFFLYTLAGSVFLLLVIIGLAFSFVDPEASLRLAIEKGAALVTTGELQESLRQGVLPPSFRVYSLCLPDIMAWNDGWLNRVPGSVFESGTQLFSISTRSLGFFALLLAFAIKLPSIPFHTWLPDAHVQAPTAVSVILAGVLLKVGGYGLIRIAGGIFPDVLAQYYWVLAIAGYVSLIYGNLVAAAQKDLKSMIAYSSIAHMAYITFGMATMHATGWNGAMMQMFNHGIISATLFLVVGAMSDRTGDRNISSYSGLWSQAPRFSIIVIIAFFGAMGLPGLSAFVSELLVFIGLFVAALKNELLPAWMVFSALIGIVLAAIVFLRAFRQMFFGKFSFKGNAHFPFPDLSIREWTMFIPLVALIIILGLFPSLLSRLSEQTVHGYIQFLQNFLPRN